MRTRAGMIEFIKSFYEKHGEGIKGLSTFFEAHGGQSCFGMGVSCIDSRIHKLLGKEHENLIGGVFLIRNMGNVVDLKNPQIRASIDYFLSHLEENLEKRNLECGFFLVEGHSDCGAVVTVHKGLGELKSPYKEALAPIERVVEKVFEEMKRKVRSPQEYMLKEGHFEEEIREMVEEAIKASNVKLEEKFKAELFNDKEIWKLVLAHENPWKIAMLLHYKIVVENVKQQILNLLEMDKARELAEKGKLLLIGAVYDIFTGKARMLEYDVKTGTFRWLT